MKKLIVPVLIVFISILLSGENSAQKQKALKGSEIPKSPAQLIDSLTTELSKASEDTNKVNIIIHIAHIKSNTVPWECIGLGEQAIALSDKLKWKKGKADALEMMGVVFAGKPDQDKALSCFEQSLKIYEDISNDLGASKVIFDIGMLYEYSSLFPKALEYFNKALKLGKEKSNKLIIAHSYGNIGRVYAKLSYYPNALDNFKKALKIAEEINEISDIGTLNGNIGLVYSELSDYKNALEFHLKALKMAEEIGDKAGVERHLGNLSAVYSNLSDNQKALENLEQALKIATEIGDKRSQGLWLGNIGNIYFSLPNYPKALEYFEKSLKIAEETNSKDEIGRQLSNIGIVYSNLNNYIKAQEYYEKSASISEEIGDKKTLEITLGNIGKDYILLNNYPKALVNLEKALNIAEDIGEKAGIERHLGNIQSTYTFLSNYPKALENLEKAVKIAKETGHKSNEYTNKLNIGILYLKIATDTLKHISDSSKKEKLQLALNIAHEARNGFNEIKEDNGVMESENLLTDIYEAMGDYKSAITAYKNHQNIKDSIYSGENKKKIAELEAKKDLEIQQKENDRLKTDSALKVSDLILKNKQLALLNNQQTLQKLEMDKKNLLINTKNNELSLLEKDKVVKALELKQKDAESEKAAKKIELLKKDRDYQSVIQNSLFGGIALLASLAVVLFLFFWRKQKDNKILEEKNKQITLQKEIIEEEQEKSEALLLNVLPPAIASRLKKGETTIADHIDEATVVFIDMVDFTKSSTGISPKQVVETLNTIYTKLDSLANKHGLEKIKTIGDCYMAAAGVPNPRTDNVEIAAGFAIDAMKLLKDYDTGDGNILNFRCGIDSGPVVAGVIGEKKFIYDIWGDTVNTAARMEAYSEPGKIHVTDRFKEKVETSPASPPLLNKVGIKGWYFQDRGEIDIKGIGMMRTYFLETK